MISRWWFQTFFIFTPTWGRFPLWLIFFRWVETTNQIWLSHVKYNIFIHILWPKALGTTKSTSQRPLDGRMFKSQGGEYYRWKWTFGSFKLSIFGGIQTMKMYGNFEWFTYKKITLFGLLQTFGHYFAQFWYIWVIFCPSLFGLLS